MSDWIEWTGGKCPVPSGTKVVLRRQDGKELTGPAGRFQWQWGVELCEDWDIVAYRIVGGKPATKANPDAVNHPSHYTDGGIETIDYIRAKLSAEGFRAYCLGNVLKYVSRAGKKGEATEDLKKAKVYLEWAIND